MENQLKHFREQKGWTQTELSKKSGVSRVTINCLENNKVQVARTDTLTKIADALEQPVSDVFFSQ